MISLLARKPEESSTNGLIRKTLLRTAVAPCPPSRSKHVELHAAPGERVLQDVTVRIPIEVRDDRKRDSAIRIAEEKERPEGDLTRPTGAARVEVRA
jgi:hypothetical protein